MNESTNHHTGGCLCGAVTYESTAPPVDAGLCHCRMCQKSTGSAFMAIAGYARDSFRITNGDPKIYQSSSIKEKGFCSNCGSLLFDRYLVDTGLSDPDIYWVQVGTLDHPDKVSMKWHVGVESQLSWIHFDDELPKSRSDEDPYLQAAFAATKSQKT